MDCVNETMRLGHSTYWQMPVIPREWNNFSALFYVNQTWRPDDTVSWIATVVPSEGGVNLCSVVSNVSAGMTSKYLARCVNGFTNITVIVHDDSFAAIDVASIPDICNLGTDRLPQTLYYEFSIRCGIDCGKQVSCVNYTRVTFNNSSNNESVELGTYVWKQWSKTKVGFTLKAFPLTNSSGGYFTSRNLPRIFDTRNPGTVLNGTPGLAGDFGNVLIVQQQESNYSQANTNGGVIVFNFTVDDDSSTNATDGNATDGNATDGNATGQPGLYVIDLGLHNIVRDVWVNVTTSDGNFTLFHVKSLNERSSQNVTIDMHNVVTIEVRMDGPSAVTHIGFCSEYEELHNSTRPPRVVTTLPPTFRPSVVP